MWIKKTGSIGLTKYLKQYKRNMKYHFFSTLCDEADAYLNQTLNDFANKQINITQAIKNLRSVECYDENGQALFPDADMTKETKYEFIENLAKISSDMMGVTVSEDTIWDIYDQVYNETFI